MLIQKLIIYCSLLLLIGTTNSFAHGGLDKRIEAKTKAIAQDPNNQQLYFERGYLHQQHEDWDKALADYIHAQNLGFEDKIIAYRLAEIYLELALFESGLVCTERYMVNNPLDIKVYKLRAQLFFQLQQYDKAIAAYTYVLTETIDLRPENYIKLSRVYIEKDSNLVDSALHTINKGLDNLGESVFILQQEKLDLLQIKGKQNAILVQYDQLININLRKEQWYYQKAQYLFDQQEYKAALATNQQAKTAFEQLKPHLQQTKAMLRLLGSIHSLEKSIHSQLKD